MSEPDRHEFIHLFFEAFASAEHDLSKMPHLLSRCAELGHADLARVLLARKDEEPDKFTWNEDEALTNAITHGHPGVLETWLSRGRPVTLDQARKAMAVWRTHHHPPEIENVPLATEMLQASAHDWIFLTELFVEAEMERMIESDPESN